MSIRKKFFDTIFLNGYGDTEILKLGMLFWETVIICPSCINNTNNEQDFCSLLKTRKFKFDCQGDLISNEINDKVYYGINPDFWYFLKNNADFLSIINNYPKFTEYDIKFNDFYNLLKKNTYLQDILKKRKESKIEARFYKNYIPERELPTDFLKFGLRESKKEILQFQKDHIIEHTYFNKYDLELFFHSILLCVSHYKKRDEILDYFLIFYNIKNEYEKEKVINLFQNNNLSFDLYLPNLNLKSISAIVTNSKYKNLLSKLHKFIYFFAERGIISNKIKVDFKNHLYKILNLNKESNIKIDKIKLNFTIFRLPLNEKIPMLKNIIQNLNIKSILLWDFEIIK